MVKTVVSTATTTTTAKPIGKAVGPGMISLINLVAYSESVTELKELWKSATMTTLRPAGIPACLLWR